MAQVTQTFQNDRDKPVYVSVEPWPECFELEPGEKLTLIWDAKETVPAAEVVFCNELDLVIWPYGAIDDTQFFINGESAVDRSWMFKHK